MKGAVFVSHVIHLLTKQNISEIVNEAIGEAIAMHAMELIIQ